MTLTQSDLLTESRGHDGPVAGSLRVEGKNGSAGGRERGSSHGVRNHHGPLQRGQQEERQEDPMEWEGRLDEGTDVQIASASVRDWEGGREEAWLPLPTPSYGIPYMI